MEDQPNLGLKVEQKIASVEEYKFEPIKGYPMLHWKGKRPFSTTQFYPAQLKETHGVDINGWLNKIFWGDNLQVMSHLLKEYRGQIDLIYIDPPYDSKAEYKKKIELKGKKIVNDRTTFEEKQYTDIWTNDEYLQFMYERLILLRELLSDTGSIYVHCDWHKVHHLRCSMDEIFGPENFRNDIIWWYLWGGRGKNQWNSKHDNILFYSKSNNWTFNYLDVLDDHNLMTEGSKNRLNYAGAMVTTKSDSSEIPEDKVLPSDTWYIATINAMAKEKENYPTQKPEKLLEKIIRASSNKDSIIFDCFMGSGTTQAVAMKLGRKFIGADINLGAIQTTTKRLLNISKDISEKLQDEIKYTGFSVYNVNHYDVFRNPVEAKELLIKALEIQPLPNNSIYDGEKDGKMVKIMPINRIATRADLNELITNFDYKKFEKAIESSPNRPVEQLLLVCMGHEADLAAELQNEVPYKLDIEVVDILRDKANLEFKRDAEAEIVIEGGKILIREFYPMNLMQKLSLMKENVDNWKELVDSIMIDFNYDGAVFEPQTVDVPEKNDLVKGVYTIPDNAGTIRVKITDVLSETFETTLNNG
jgi:site-specific DNA-methyltransferase (adenine-specific)